MSHDRGDRPTLGNNDWRRELERRSPARPVRVRTILRSERPGGRAAHDAAVRRTSTRSRRWPRRTFHGLPGLLADSLPDRFGTNSSMPGSPDRDAAPVTSMPSSVLCYVGTRAWARSNLSPRQAPRTRPNPSLSPTSWNLQPNTSLAHRLEGSLATPRRTRTLRHMLKVRHVGRRRKGQGAHRLESGHRPGPLRTDYGWRRLQLLAREVRRRGRQPGPGARRSPGLRADRIRLSPHGAGSGHPDDRMPDLHETAATTS